MDSPNGRAVLGPDIVFRGRIRNARIVEIHGYVEGEVTAKHILVARGGRFFGTMQALTAEILGDAQGEIFVKSLVRIGETGIVSGKVQYGSIAMAPGGELTAELRNVPPTLTGDFEISVHRGRSAILTRADLRAVDPDDAPEDLTFTVGRVLGGHVGLKGNPLAAIATFTQADLDAGRVLFQHDGSAANDAGFEISVADDDGATAGTPQTVKVEVQDLPERRRAG